MKRLLLALMLLWLAALVQPALATDTVYYYYTNPLHSAVVVTDAHGNVVERTYYAPYGQVLNRSMRDGPGYTGHEEDPETSLVYMQQRYYDPETGRFLSTDPVSPTSNGTSFNRYWYAKDNPYRYTDPDGRCVEDACIAEGSVALGAGVVYVAAAALIATGVCVEACGRIKNAIGGTAESIYDHIVHSAAAPPLPKDLVGTPDSKSRQQGGRVNNGPLAPEHGGTNDDEKDFGKLTGGKFGPAPADRGYPEGTRVGENGISHRPATESSGARIDIPANGSKPAETLHYPKPTPPPPPPHEVNGSN